MKENTKTYHFIFNEVDYVIIEYKNNKLYIAIDNLPNNILKDIISNNYLKAIEDYEWELKKQILDLQYRLKEVKQFKRLLEKEN